MEPTRGAAGVARNTAVLAVARVAERTTALVLALLIGAHLGAAALGAYSVAITIYYLFATIGDAGTSSYLTREVSRDPSRTGPYIVHLSAVAAIASLLIMGLGLAILPLLGYAGDIEASVGIVILAVLPRTLNSLQEGAFIAFGRTEFQMLTTLGGSVLQLAISVWLLSHGHGVPSIIASFVAIQYGACLVYFVLLSKYIARLRTSFDWSLAWQLLMGVKTFAATSAMASLFARPELIVLSLVASAREVGYYSAAVRIAEVWLLLPEVFMNNVFPVLSETFGVAEDRFAEVQRQAMRVVLAYSLPLAAVMITTAPLIVGALFGERFAPSVDLLRLLAFNVVLMGIGTVYWRVLYARGLQAVVLRVQIIMAVVRIVVAVVLIAALVALGAAIATPASSALTVVLFARASRRQRAPAAPLTVGLRFAAAAAAAGIAGWTLMNVGLPIWVVAPAAGATYGIASLALGAITVEDRAELRRLFAGRAGARARVG